MKASFLIVCGAVIGLGCSSPPTPPQKVPNDADHLVTPRQSAASQSASAASMQRSKDPEPLDFDLKAMPESSEPDLDASAKAMEARATAYGYKGVTAKVVVGSTGAHVRLSCATGMTLEMNRVLRDMAGVPGQKVEVRLPRYLSKPEEDQKLYTYEKKTAPDGAKWYRHLDTDDSWLHVTPRPRLLRDEPVLSTPEVRVSEIPVLHEVSFSCVLKFVEGKKETLAKTWDHATLLVDGEIVAEFVRVQAKPILDPNEDFGDGPIHFSFRDQRGVLSYCLKHPMPLRLTPVMRVEKSPLER